MSEEKIHKVRRSRRQRLMRLLRALFDPRALAHMAKVMNYYNYTHAAEIGKVQMGEDCAISPMTSFSNGQNIELGDRVSIGANCSLWAGAGTARIVLKEDVLLAPNVMITAANYRFNDGSPVTAQPMKEADIVIGRDVWLGYGVVILAGTTIGDGAIIGAGALVRGDIPPNAIVTSDVAKVVGYRKPPGAASVETD